MKSIVLVISQIFSSYKKLQNNKKLQTQQQQRDNTKTFQYIHTNNKKQFKIRLSLRHMHSGLNSSNKSTRNFPFFKKKSTQRLCLLLLVLYYIQFINHRVIFDAPHEPHLRYFSWHMYQKFLYQIRIHSTYCSNKIKYYL